MLGSQACGLNGQSFYGPTFSGGWLYFARSCNLNCGSARYGAYRYRLRDGRYEIAGDGRPVKDWAWGGDGTAYQLRARPDVGCTDNRVACTLVWKNGLRFKRVARQSTREPRPSRVSCQRPTQADRGHAVCCFRTNGPRPGRMDRDRAQRRHRRCSLQANAPRSTRLPLRVTADRRRPDQQVPVLSASGIRI